MKAQHASPSGPNDYNPVEFIESLKGSLFRVAVTEPQDINAGIHHWTLTDSDIEYMAGTATGFQQWQYAGRGNAYQLRLETGKTVWSTDVWGTHYIVSKLKRED